MELWNEFAFELSHIANLSAVLTAAIAVLAYGQFVVLARLRRRRLERYLKSVEREGQGQKSVLHLMARLSMTEAEVMTAAFHSPRIQTRIRADGSGLADRLLFQYGE